MVLCEIVPVRQQEPHLRRRWFRDDYFDVFTWQNGNGSIVGFQLCYDLPADERVLSWRVSTGYAYHRVDDGEASPIKNMTPILTPDGALPLTTVLAQFDQRAAELDPAVRTFLRERLLEYGTGAPIKN